MPCHCGSSLPLQQCCFKYINQLEIPETAEQLMRSRFTAFKIRQHEYLIKTCRSEKPLKTTDFDQNMEWLGLQVISSSEGRKYDHRGTVEFVAFFHPCGDNTLYSFEQLHEKSYFEKVDDHWLYIDGQPLTAIKPGRNEACFCQSGKKFKKCHGK